MSRALYTTKTIILFSQNYLLMAEINLKREEHNASKDYET